MPLWIVRWVCLFALLAGQGCAKKNRVKLKSSVLPLPDAPKAYISIEKRFEKFVALRIQKGMSSQQKQIQLLEKRRLLDAVTVDYQRYIASSKETNTWTVKAYCRVGDSFWNFSHYFKMLQPAPQYIRTRVVAEMKKVLEAKKMNPSQQARFMNQPNIQARIQRMTQHLLKHAAVLVERQRVHAVKSAQLWYQRCLEQARINAIEGGFLQHARARTSRR